MANAETSRIVPPQKTALPAPGMIGKLSGKAPRGKKQTEGSVDFFAEFAHLPIREDDPEYMSDPQEQYDEDLQEYSSPSMLDRPGETHGDFDAQFRNDFFRYSQDFQDRRGGAPGIDQDFGTPMEPDSLRARSEGSLDDRIREEILDLFTRERSLKANNVDAQVEDGLVTLTGTVPDAEFSAAIEDAVQSVPGVEGVENRLGQG